MIYSPESDHKDRRGILFVHRTVFLISAGYKVLLKTSKLLLPKPFKTTRLTDLIRHTTIPMGFTIPNGLTEVIIYLSADHCPLTNANYF